MMMMMMMMMMIIIIIIIIITVCYRGSVMHKIFLVYCAVDILQ
jgi:hypothetical protein